MQTIILNFILFLALVWLIMGSYFFLCLVLIEKKAKADEKKQVEDSKDENKEISIPYSLVGKSKAFVAEKVDNKKEENTNKTANIAEKETSSVNNQTDQSSPTNEQSNDNSSEEENELNINYTTEEDENEIIKEELPLEVEEVKEVSTSAILTRDIQRMRGWKQKDDALEELSTENKESIQRLRGTDLLEKYKEYLMRQENDHQKLLTLIRQAEEDDSAETVNEDSNVEQPFEKEEEKDKITEDKPLAYYL